MGRATGRAIGGVAGAGLGSFGGPLGIMAGGAVGSMLGGALAGPDDNPYAGIHFDPRPADQAIYDPATMSARNALAKEYSNLSYNSAPLEKFTAEAMRTGPSAALDMAKRDQGILSMQAMDQARATAAGNAATARSNLAAQGGLSSGAGAYIGAQAGRSAMDASQKISQNLSNQNRLLDMADEKQRVEQLALAPAMQQEPFANQLGMAKDLFSAGRRDVEQQQAQIQRENQRRQEDWAAEQQRKAMYASGEDTGDSWLCTKYGPNAEDKNIMKAMRKYFLEKDPTGTNIYLKDGADLVKRMEAAGYDWAKNNYFVKKILQMARTEDIDMVHKAYKNHCILLFRQYWPEHEVCKGAI